jgi:hypothetical protein
VTNRSSFFALLPAPSWGSHPVRRAPREKSAFVKTFFLRHPGEHFFVHHTEKLFVPAVFLFLLSFFY